MKKKKKNKLYERLQQMSMDEYQKYLNEIENGYIKAQKHPEDENIVILNYTRLTTFKKRWNRQTMRARGLILDITDANDNGIIHILSRPMEKFFNAFENIEYEKTIDFNNEYTVMEKLDGSLGISYLINGEIRFATRGSFTSEQAIKATQMWKEKYLYTESKFWRLFSGSIPTLLVEIIYPDNRIVVDYGGEEKLVLLGVNVDKHTSFSPEQVRKVGNYFHLPVAKQYHFSLRALDQMRESLSSNEEGWVVRFCDDKRLKIKGSEYIRIHKMRYGMSKKETVKAWSEGTLDAYIMSMPEEFRIEIESFRDNLDKKMNEMHGILWSTFDGAKNLTDKKEFAMFTIKNIDKSYHKFMFDAYKNGKVSGALVKEHIYKNYREYI